MLSSFPKGPWKTSSAPSIVVSRSRTCNTGAKGGILL